MKGLVVVSLLILVVASHSRPIRDDRKWVSETMVTCEATYGFLPCSSNVWGMVFMIVVYEILLSLAGQYVAEGSSLFLEIIGPGVVGASVFQFLGSIPRLILVLVPLLTGTEDYAQRRASTGMATILGGVALNLTLIWGLTVILGSNYLAQDDVDGDGDSKTQETNAEIGVVTDVETSWTARLVLVASLPFVILELQNIFSSQSGKRVVILFAFIVTVVLLCAYVLLQSFQPWIHNRCFEYVMDRNAKDKLLQLLSANGKPDTRKIQQTQNMNFQFMIRDVFKKFSLSDELFNKIVKDNRESVTAAEIRVLIVGVEMGDKDARPFLDLDTIAAYFDTSSDGDINREEFIIGMTKLASTLVDQTKVGKKNTQDNRDEQQALLASSMTPSQTTSNSWLIYLRATFFFTFGLAIASALAEPTVTSIINFADAANISSFLVSYVVLPLALGYGVILRSIASALQKDQRSNSLTLSSLYSGVFMTNMMGLLPFLVPVYFRNLSTDVSAELHVVLLICISIGILTSFNTKFPRWMGYVVLCLYPISLLTLYILTSVLGWS